MPYTDAREFAAALPPQARLLGLDVGSETIGLSLCDAGRRIASPLETIRRGKFSKDAGVMQALIEKHAVGGLVIGYPVNMDGTLGPRTQSVRTFCGTLARTVMLPMLLWDERLSTVAVQRVMLEADLSRARRAELVDKLAAAYILQAALDAMNA